MRQERGLRTKPWMPPQKGQRNEVVVRGSPGTSLRQRKAHVGRRMELSPTLVPRTAIPWP